MLVRSGYRSALQLTLLVTLINLCAIPVWAIVTSYINERFPTGVRASGYGIGYSAATIIPAFSSFYMLGLKGLGMPYEYTEIVIFAVGGFLLLLGALSGPETKHVEMAWNTILRRNRPCPAMCIPVSRGGGAGRSRIPGS